MFLIKFATTFCIENGFSVTLQTQTLTLETSLNEAALKILFSFKNNSLISYIEKPTPVPTKPRKISGEVNSSLFTW